MNRIDMPLYDEANEILSRNPNVHDFDEAYAIALKGDLCTTCDPDKDIDCGWEEEEDKQKLYWISHYQTDGGDVIFSTVYVKGIWAYSMNEALVGFNNLYLDCQLAISIFEAPTDKYRETTVTLVGKAMTYYMKG